MANPKAQTLQQKLGFFDEDLKKPKHDDLMLLLDRNIEKVVNNLFNIPFTDNDIIEIEKCEVQKLNSIKDIYNETIIAIQKDVAINDVEKRRKSPDHSSSDEDLHQLLTNIKQKKNILDNFNIKKEIKDKPRITLIEKKWEVPVITGWPDKKYTVGFIDFSATFNVPQLKLSGLIYSQERENSKCHYYDIDEKQFGFNYERLKTTILVEVKTEIKSVGELIRQINHYKTYHWGNYYVLCPGTKFRDILSEQGINYITVE